MNPVSKPIAGTAHAAPARGILAAVAVLSLAACAAPGTSDVRTDVHCVEYHQVPVVIEGQLHMVRGGCKAWTVGPTPKERERFNQLHGIEDDAQ